jgi:hypothetical protein
MALATLSSFATTVDISDQKPSTELVLRMPDEQFMAIATHLDIQNQVLGFANAVIHQQPKDSLSGLPKQKKSSWTNVMYPEQSESESEYERHEESLTSDSTAAPVSNPADRQTVAGGSAKQARIKQAAEDYISRKINKTVNTAPSFDTGHSTGHVPNSSTNPVLDWSNRSSYLRSSEPVNMPKAPFAPDFDADSALGTDDYGYPLSQDRLDTARTRGVPSWLDSVNTTAPDNALASGNTRTRGWNNEERLHWRDTGKMPVSGSTSPAAAEPWRAGVKSSLRPDEQHPIPSSVYWKPRSLRDDVVIPPEPQRMTADEMWEHEQKATLRDMEQQWEAKHAYEAVLRDSDRSPSPIQHQRSPTQPRSPARRKQPSPQGGDAYLFSPELSREEAANKLWAQSSFSEESDYEDCERTVPRRPKLTRKNMLAHVRQLGLLPGPWELAEEEAASDGEDRSFKARICEQDEVKLLRGYPSLYL